LDLENHPDDDAFRCLAGEKEGLDMKWAAREEARVDREAFLNKYRLDDPALRYCRSRLTRT